MTLRKTTEQEKNAFLYLNQLRRSGATNMHRATPYLQLRFSITQEDARNLLGKWMRVFNDEGNYDEIEEED